jgi:beta-lactamase superfamily II metal-dependent hydrolase
LLIAWGVVSARGRVTERLTLLPLSGSAALFWEQARNDRSILINCGSEFSAGFTLKPFLRARGVNQLENLVLTQGDIRLCGGAALLDNLFHIRHAWAGEHSARSPAYKQALGLFTDGSNRLSLIGAGAKIGDLEVLYPTSDTTFSRAQDNALVLAGNIGNSRLLYLPELGKAGQQALLEHPEQLKANIVIAGLPPQGQPMKTELLAAIHPKLIILADSEQPTTQRASDKLMSRLESFGAPVLALHKEGAITLESSGSDLVVRAMSGRNCVIRQR